MKNIVNYQKYNTWINPCVKHAPVWDLSRNNISWRKIADAAFDANKEVQKKMYEDEESSREAYRNNAMKKLRPILSALGVDIKVYKTAKKGYLFPALAAYFCWFALTAYAGRGGYISQLINSSPVSSVDEADFFLFFSSFANEKIKDGIVPLCNRKTEIIKAVFHK